MEPFSTSMSVPRFRPAEVALGVLAVAAILGLLYLGRPILVPVTLAVVLSFAIGPQVRMLRRLGLGHVSSVLGAVAVTGLVVLMLATVIGTQAVQMASNLPAYQGTFRANVRELRTAALARLEPTWKAAERMLDPLEGEGAESGGKEELRSPAPPTAPTSVIPVEIRPPKARPTPWLHRLLAL